MAELRIAANWQVSGTGIWGVTPLNARVRIAEVTLIAPSNGVNWVDHARMIAAAPDLLAALKVLSGVCPLGTAKVRDALNIASAAIAKAEG